MSIWTRIAQALSALTKGESLSQVFERLIGPPERSVAFTIAVIALGAKMAKADGKVTRDEVSAFRTIFTIAPEDEADAARVFDLARQDVAGFDAYARKIAAMFGAGDRVLTDLMEGLFHIALADGEYHAAEAGFLAEVAGIFGLSERDFRALERRFAPGEHPDPYEVLGLPHGAPMAEVRKAWRQAVRESHPDGMRARGVPPEAVKLAEERLVAVNRAWDEIGGKVPA